MPSLLPTKIFEPCPGRWQIERKAWRCLEECRQQLGLDELPIPIPVDAWIEAPLGIRFGFADLSHLGKDVLGAAYVADREILIDEKVLAHEGRFRFTCAHELGHVVLHSKVQSVFQESSDIGFLASPDLYERHADRFAAAFLMPVPLLERELVRIFQAQGLMLARATADLMHPTPESEWLWRKVVLPQITRRFDVSFSAAVHRFNDIRPRIDDTVPLMPWELVEVLLVPAPADSPIDSTFVEDGVAVSRSLFKNN